MPTQRTRKATAFAHLRKSTMKIGAAAMLTLGAFQLAESFLAPAALPEVFAVTRTIACTIVAFGLGVLLMLFFAIDAMPDSHE